MCTLHPGPILCMSSSLGSWQCCPERSYKPLDSRKWATQIYSEATLSWARRLLWVLCQQSAQHLACHPGCFLQFETCHLSIRLPLAVMFWKVPGHTCPSSRSQKLRREFLSTISFLSFPKTKPTKQTKTPFLCRLHKYITTGRKCHPLRHGRPSGLPLTAQLRQLRSSLSLCVSVSYRE